MTLLEFGFDPAVDHPLLRREACANQRERSQRASRSRSACVMCVTFPSGIAFRTTACSSIACAWDSISARVSRRTPFGAVETPGAVGFAEWHGTQRARMTAFAFANGTAGPTAGTAGVLGGRMR